MRSMIRNRVKEAGITQAELARRIGVDKQTVFRWCGDGIRVLTLGKAERVADALGCRVRDLFDED